MSLAPALLEILACPQDKGALYYLEAESILYNPRLQRSYAIRDDIPGDADRRIDTRSTPTEHGRTHGCHRRCGRRSDVQLTPFSQGASVRALQSGRFSQGAGIGKRAVSDTRVMSRRCR